MRIELKKIKFFEAMSEETNAFVADVFINGTKVAYTKNEGHGGCTFYHLYDIKHRELLKEAEAFCLALPPVRYRDFEFPMNLEYKINELFEHWLKEKDIAKMLLKLQKSMLNSLCLKTENGYTELSWKSGRRKLTIAELVSVPNGRETLRNAIAKAKAEGREVLNTNIPQELF